MKGIIFDFNGTLFWDSELHYEAWRYYSKLLRGTPFSDEEMQIQMFGHTNSDIIEYALGYKPTDDVIQKYASEKEEHYRSVCLQRPDIFHLAPGAENFLNFLKSNNIPMAIATMSEWSNVEFYIKHFNLYKWFNHECIVYSDGTIPGKPAPDIFKIAASRLNLKPSECLIIEDAVSGIEAAKNAHAGLIYAIASMEPVSFYKSISGINNIINNFDEINRDIFLH